MKTYISIPDADICPPRLTMRQTFNPEAPREQAFRRSVAEGARLMTERLTLDEQMRVSFLPLVITRLAWHYAAKAMDCAARDKVAILKKLGRTLKEARQDYEGELRRELDHASYANVARQTDECIGQMRHDLDILYFSVNGEFKRAMPDYPYDEMRTYAIMSALFVGLLQAHNRDMDRLLADRLRPAAVPPTVMHPATRALRTAMEAYAGADGKFDHRAPNVQAALNVVKIRLDRIEFGIF